MRNDPIDKWITKLVPGQTFVDIGGIGENSGNERISTAVKGYAAGVAMADSEPYSSLLWQTFFQIMRDQNINDFQTHELIDVRDTYIQTKLPKFDIVHCTGVLYHIPDPITSLYNIAGLANDYLIVNTVTIPNRVKNKKGRFITDDSRAVFLPSLTEADRRVLGEHYRSKFGWDINVQAPRLGEPNPRMPYLREDGLSSYPYWWLFTQHAFRHAVQMMGFEIEKEWVWENHTLALLARRQ